MKKRRGTVYVRPGKDVTLYVPAETPPEVIDYLNRLKEEGMFSQGVMDIVTEYVQKQPRANAVLASGESAYDVAFPDHNPLDAPASFSDARDDDDAWMDSLASGRISQDTAYAPPPEGGHQGIHNVHLDEISADVPDENDVRSTQDPAPRKKFDLAQIFRQAQRNSGKLMGTQGE